jgi:hypothetical protein
VTHHGSPDPPLDAFVPEASAAAREEPLPGAGSAALSSALVPEVRGDATFGRRCHWCDQQCSPFVRRDYLRGRRRAVRSRPP